eukprot:CAMPEP_0119106584 /NCGR_PEP_ID=MMETSP1180-20130426/5042_1 /TAXON_ID=3052 ORGANISM="Chlamydomonas cf sp, Strain CCMP681" /NCGR_SAMPLE_ID=MMETSP1180 /ASSEMBLY_ACC=CAM_ASM_000741 /LENGTH=338 /DNA_ID=CAMNT_0007091947 /DNA_START=36 /DNA_END=1052 /DNA_ORIENTATION=-
MKCSIQPMQRACTLQPKLCAGSITSLRAVLPSLSPLPLRQRCVAFAKEPLSDVEEGTVGDFCQLDEFGVRIKGRKSVGEMEQDFLAALSAWFFEGKAIMNDAEFAALKEELLWNGSKVAVLDSTELTFLQASMSYAKGKPIMTDDEYNLLKQELKLKSSVVAAEGPRCSLRSKKMYADAKPDYLRMLAINVPAALLVLGLVFSIDDLTGFEITKAIELPPPYGVVLLWGLLLPTTFVLASAITNLAFKDSLVLKGNCPNCGAENFTYFGEVLSVGGNRGQNSCDCVSCGAGLTFDENKRILVVNETAEDKAVKNAAAAAKKAASAAKKKARVAVPDKE